MNDDLIKMAQKAHKELVSEDYPGQLGEFDPWTMRLLARFAALVIEYDQKQYELNDESLESVQIEIPYIDKLIEAAVLAERNECAKVCDDWPDYDVQGLAESIRARSEK